MRDIIFTKYSNERAREFSIRTDIYEAEKAGRFVCKRACYPEGREHVDRMSAWYQALEQVYRETPISMNRILHIGEGTEEEDIYPGEGVCFEYLDGETLEEQLDRRLSEGDVDGAVEQLLTYIRIVRQTGRVRPFAVTEEFRKVFGETDLPDGLFCQEVTDIDMVVGNAFVRDGGWTMMDYEWTFDFPIPINYVVFRILHFYIHGSTVRTALYTKNLYSRAGLNEKELCQYEKMEEHFQQYVLGTHIPLRFLYPEMNPGLVDFRDRECREKIHEICSTNRQNEENRQKIQIYVDTIERAEDILRVKGWSFNGNLKRPDLTVWDGEGRQIVIERLEFSMRRDVNASFGMEDSGFEAGFDLTIRLFRKRTKRIGEKYILKAQVGEESASYILDMSKLSFKCGTLGRKLLELRAGKNVQGPVYESTYEMGFFGETGRFRKENQIFEGWRLATALTKKELKRQQQERFPKEPLISIVIPLYNTPEQYLKAMLDSVLAQTYGKFEICLADGSSSELPGQIIGSQYSSEERIHYRKLKENLGISENTNEALAMASGEYIMLADHDDLLAPNALYEIVKMINAHFDADIIYTDEDKVDMKGEHYFDPHFKPDFNLYMLRSSNYICHIFTVRRSIAEAVGGFEGKYDGAQDYDFILKCTEQAKGIYHVPRILYHWRCHLNSTASNPESKLYAWDSGRKALQAHYRRMGIQAETELGDLFGRYRTKWQIEGEPLVSIVIPNKDHRDELMKCIGSIYKKSTYRHFEVIVAENNSKESRTFACYEELKKKYSGIRVIRWEGDFNYSAINNFAVKEAKGDYLLLLNNDTEVMEPCWLEEMLGICQQEDVGAVGAKLFYPDGTIQHAGVIVGLCGAAGHIFSGMKGDACGYAARADSMQNLSAVTAACMMTKKSVFLQAGGFDEKLGVALNDVDYCMKVTELGKKVVYTPYAKLFHDESRTRGVDSDLEKKARFKGEEAYFKQKWPDILKNGDPYYNINLTRVNGKCSLRIPE